VIVLCSSQVLFNQSLGNGISQTSPVLVNKGDRFPAPGHESLTLAFCLATRRCMNLGHSFLEASTPSFSSISQICVMVLCSSATVGANGTVRALTRVGCGCFSER
jgi:hypothetical protein